MSNLPWLTIIVRHKVNNIWLEINLLLLLPSHSMFMISFKELMI
ncbi:hypothetical protein MtrunA17_Chr2g0313181 [Medicago truncatula]|uniref:Uncharacterized protein n=1 Tax=Medicago truncatula TaxID=3880 RepID=A0A396JDJ9_MEDTR|nr:hypothetical protein MtrunA17_Chr2g0313181 [Medicago truncatula]